MVIQFWFLGILFVVLAIALDVGKAAYQSQLAELGTTGLVLLSIDLTTPAVAGFLAALLAGVLTTTTRRNLGDAIRNTMIDMKNLSHQSRQEINQVNRMTLHFNKQTTEWFRSMNDRMNKHAKTWDGYLQSRIENLHGETRSKLEELQKKLVKLAAEQDAYMQQLHDDTKTAKRLGKAMESFKAQVEGSDRFNEGVASSTIHLERVLKQCDEVLNRCEVIESQFRRIPRAYTVRQLTVFGVATAALVVSILALTLAQ